MENERIKNALSVGGIEASSSETPNTTEHARISECFSITEAVAPFFKLYGYKKSDVVQSNQVREILIEYGTTNVSLIKINFYWHKNTIIKNAHV